MNHKKRRETVEEYNNYKLYYTITENQYDKERNRQSYEPLKELLAEVGVYLDINKDIDGKDKLVLGIMGETYMMKTTRNAGKRQTVTRKKDSKEYELYRYSDIVYMLQTMSDIEIIEKMQMSRTTYYRHKKEMMKSNYYALLDQDRLSDQKYLQSVRGNLPF